MKLDLVVLKIVVARVVRHLTFLVFFVEQTHVLQARLVFRLNLIIDNL